MIRTQIQLTKEQARKVRQVARERGISMAEVIRRCIERGIDDEAPALEERYARAREVVGTFRDREGKEDVSERHDEYLDGSYR